ncbi:hypothetical protein J6590_016729 [Homalodisca vitripennis]|nr:hypothetical protein J6590_016729 [Homalodisca vitripennis]
MVETEATALMFPASTAPDVLHFVLAPVNRLQATALMFPASTAPDVLHFVLAPVNRLRNSHSHQVILSSLRTQLAASQSRSGVNRSYCSNVPGVYSS